MSAASAPAPAQADPFPIYTYLMALGLSPADVRATGDAMMVEIRKRIAVMAKSDDADARRRYLDQSRDGLEYRAQVNQQLIGDVFIAFNFSAAELRQAEQILGITGLAARVVKGPLIGRTVGLRGPEDFEFLERSDSRTVLRSLRDGKIHQF